MLHSNRYGERVTAQQSRWHPKHLRRFSCAAIAIAVLCVTSSIYAESLAESGLVHRGDLKLVTKEPPPGKVIIAALYVVSSAESGLVHRGDFKLVTKESLLGKDAIPAHQPVKDNATLVTMDQAIALAMDNSNLLKIARAKQEQSQGEFVQTRSGYLPQLGIEGNYSNAYREDKDSIVDQETRGTDTIVDQETRGTVSRASVRFSQLLYDFGKTTGSIGVGKSNLSAAEANLEKEIKRVLFEVKQSYFEVLATNRLIEVATASVKSFSEHLERTKSYYNAGVRTRVDIINAEVELSNANKNLSRARFNHKIAKTTFEQALGIRPHQGRYYLKDVEVNIDNLMQTMPPVIEDIDTLITLAVEQRPDVAQLIKLSEAAAANVDKTKAEFLPAIKLEARINDYDTQLTAYEDSMEVGVTATWELFSGLNTTGALATAQGRLREYQAQLQELESTITSEVTESWLRTAENRESVEITLKTLALAKENLVLAEKRYQTGAYDVLEFNEAQRNLTRAQIELVVSYYGYLTSLARLDYVVGK